MSFSRSRRILFSSSMVLVLVIFVLLLLQIDCNCKAGAIRILTESSTTGVEKFNESSSRNYISPAGDDYKISKEDKLRKYFNERASSYVLNKTEKGSFEDSKRRVPSCPDPLHN